MSTISIHGLAPVVEQKLRGMAKERGQSLNSTIKELLQDSLAPGYSSRHRAKNRAIFADLFGTWTDEQADEFDRATADFRIADPEDWQ